jgi:hypothetical protein
MGHIAVAHQGIVVSVNKIGLMLPEKSRLQKSKK